MEEKVHSNCVGAVAETIFNQWLQEFDNSRQHAVMYTTAKQAAKGAGEDLRQVCITRQQKAGVAHEHGSGCVEGSKARGSPACRECIGDAKTNTLTPQQHTAHLTLHSRSIGCARSQVRGEAWEEPPSPREKRSGKPASVPPSPPRLRNKKGRAVKQRDHHDEDVADLQSGDPWDEADGQDADDYGAYICEPLARSP
ncbi:hypothetical protein CYMTET_17641 [Cymbomonas tetramitiformis]|uniref:Uncharacterized protein n=1 Tax=Cymbomonas tetramitiformis TaxID=36881 RepID=A0AAE0L6R6_9CHLO|nr:hypothetical protein CYMTET_17641 [Cymbomonas tetramitiformis]